MVRAAVGGGGGPRGGGGLGRGGGGGFDGGAGSNRRYSLTFSVNARNVLNDVNLATPDREPEFAVIRTVERPGGRPVLQRSVESQNRVAGVVQLLATCPWNQQLMRHYCKKMQSDLPFAGISFYHSHQNLELDETRRKPYG